MPTTVISIMSIRVKPTERETAVAAFRQRRVLEECAAAIPGFRQGDLLADLQAEDRLMVIAEWSDQQSYIDWSTHPSRDLQERDLAHFLTEAPTVQLMQRRT